MKKKDSLVKRIHIDNTAEELKRLDAAKERTMTQLGQLYEKALQEVGEVNAAIFEVHQMMLEDDDYQDAIHSMIHLGFPAYTLPYRCGEFTTLSTVSHPPAGRVDAFGRFGI